MSFDNIKILNQENFPAKIIVVGRFNVDFVDDNYKTLLSIASEKLDTIDNFKFRTIYQDIEKTKKEIWYWHYYYEGLSIYDNKNEEKIKDIVAELGIKFAESKISDDMYISFDIDEYNYIIIYDKETDKFDKLMNGTDFEKAMKETNEDSNLLHTEV